MFTFAEMRKKMCNIESKMKSQLSKVAAALGLQENKAIKLETTPQFGHFFRVTLKVRNYYRYFHLVVVRSYGITLFL